MRTGIFKCIIQNNKIFIIEINSRITGMTPFLTMLQNKNNEIPFQLLHILELGNFEYEIIDPQKMEYYPYSKKII